MILLFLILNLWTFPLTDNDSTKENIEFIKFNSDDESEEHYYFLIDDECFCEECSLLEQNKEEEGDTDEEVDYLDEDENYIEDDLD